MGKRYYYKPKPRRLWSGFLSGFIGLWLLVELLGIASDSVLAILFLGTMASFGYAAIRLPLSKQKTLSKTSANKALEDLKQKIKQVDRQVKLLDTYLADKAWTQYGVLAQQVLPQIANIKQDARELRQHMDTSLYKRITGKADTITTDITKQLNLLHVSTENTANDTTEERILRLAPEILQTYRSIQTDHQTILGKIKESDNQAELQALHDTNMKRFEDILTGYLKIKESPKNFHNADERLSLARQALEQFDLDLDQSLRELNESDLADFEVSLRMMTKTSHDPLQDSKLDQGV